MAQKREKWLRDPILGKKRVFRAPGVKNGIFGGEFSPPSITTDDPRKRGEFSPRSITTDDPLKRGEFYPRSITSDGPPK